MGLELVAILNSRRRGCNIYPLAHILSVTHWHLCNAGIKAAKFIASGVAVDVMLLDIQMPGKTGVEVVREAVPKPPYPIIAMTGHVDADSLNEFRYKHIMTVSVPFSYCYSLRT